MTTVAQRPRVPRTQAERRATSRAKLLDATVQSLAELGYASTSLPEVVRRAGLSNGALWRHFRSKAELLAAAALRAEESLLEAVALDPLDERPASERVEAVVTRLLAWSREPAFQAILELLVASRSDLELRAALRATDERAAMGFFQAVRQLVGPGLAAHPHFETNVRQLGLSLYGLALTQHLRPARADAAVAQELRGFAQRLFDVGHSSHRSVAAQRTSRHRTR